LLEDIKQNGYDVLLTAGKLLGFEIQLHGIKKDCLDVRDFFKDHSNAIHNSSSYPLVRK